MNEILINEKNFESARKKIRENLSSEIIFCSDDDDLNRKILAKNAKQNGVIIGINFDEIIESSGKNKSEILARVKQNILLCNKNKLKMRFIILKGNSRNIYDLKALGLILGMPTWMTKAL